MARSDEQITPDRLVDAADALLKAIAEATAEGVMPANAAGLMGTPAQPACLVEYTKFEIEQAAEFLARLDMLPTPQKKA